MLALNRAGSCGVPLDYQHFWGTPHGLLWITRDDLDEDRIRYTVSAAPINRTSFRIQSLLGMYYFAWYNLPEALDLYEGSRAKATGLLPFKHNGPENPIGLAIMAKPCESVYVCKRELSPNERIKQE